MRFKTLCHNLSQERLTPYIHYIRSKTQDNIDYKVVELYIWNSKVSASLLELIHYYEVSLRNTISHAINQKFTFGIQERGFIRSIPKTERDILNKLINNLQTNKKLSNGKIISGLNLGFWETLLKMCFYKNKKANNSLLPLSSFKQPINNADILKMVNITRNLRKNIRNRICHHETIINISNILTLYYDVIWVIEKLDPKLKCFVIRNTKNIIDLLNNRPI